MWPPGPSPFCLKATYRWCLWCGQNESSLTVSAGILLRYIALLKMSEDSFFKGPGLCRSPSRYCWADHLSGFFSWSKLVWNCGQLKKKKKIQRAVSPRLINKKVTRLLLQPVLSVALLSFTPAWPLPSHSHYQTMRLWCHEHRIIIGLLSQEMVVFLSATQRWKSGIFIHFSPGLLSIVVFRITSPLFISSEKSFWIGNITKLLFLVTCFEFRFMVGTTEV